jgi:hypothetical protein
MRLSLVDDAAFSELEAKTRALSAGGDEAAAEAVRAALWEKQKAMDSRAEEIGKLERQKKFSAEEMCHVSKEKSLVGRRAELGASPEKRLLTCSSLAPPPAQRRVQGD